MITSHRLYNQQILSPRFTKPGDLVKWMGAVQAQDYAGSLWAIGLRLKNQNESHIEKAIEQKQIVRSWPMRGTLHFVVPETLRWMLKYLAPRVIQRTATIYKQAGLDSKVFSKSAKVISKALLDTKQLTRNELYAILERSKIPTGEQRGLHILGHLAQQGLICFGPRKGKQHSFVLLDEWLPSAPMPSRDIAIATLAKIFFESHAPATIQDFAWWAGLTLSEARAGLDELISDLTKTQIDGSVYYSGQNAPTSDATRSVFLLPSFDEYFVAYKDRKPTFNPKFLDLSAKSGNGIFSSPIVINGLLSGVWKKTIRKNDLLVEVKPFERFTKPLQKALNDAGERLAKFSSMPVVIE